MRTEQIQIYTFDELSESAKQSAIQDYREGNTEYFWLDEWVDSLKKFADVTGIKIDDYGIGAYCYAYVRWSFDPFDWWLDKDTNDLSGLRLRTWLINNWLPEFEKGKYDSLGIYHKSRYSKIQTEVCFTLTGYCGDMPLIDPILEFISKPDNSSLHDIIEDCFSRWVNECQADLEYQDSDEFIIEEFNQLGSEFLDDGSIA